MFIKLIENGEDGEKNMMKKKTLRVYSRIPVEGQYPNGLAYSVHMALGESEAEVIEGENCQTKKDIEWKPLHNDYGILFPKADIDERNVIIPKFAADIRIAEVCSTGNTECGNNANGALKAENVDSKKQFPGEHQFSSYYITGADVVSEGYYGQADMANESEGDGKGGQCFWTWVTEDFVNYEECGLLTADELEKRTGLSLTQLREKDSVKISDEIAVKISKKWDSTKVEEYVGLPENEALRSLKEQKDFQKFPLARGFGDPVILFWEDEYYFIATNDNVGDIGLYVRKSHTIDGLFAEDIEMHLILDKDEKRHLIQTFWAPEFHVIGGRLCILFAVSNEQWGPKCHMMRLKENGDILKASDWEDPVEVKRAGGLILGAHGITLDMTYVKSGSRHYYVWSYRENIGSPLDSGSMIMVGEFDPENPTELITEPVCLSRPLYGFENTRGTINNEGPYAFYHNEKIYLTYSGGDARGYLYTTCLLTAKDGDNLCDPGVWEKAKTPALSFASVPGVYGPGHNSFFRDRNGDWWIAFHAVTDYQEKVISDCFRRVVYDDNGEPRFDGVM